jgi:glycosyltransferase involved in cell wall biosynthesis
MSCGIPVVATNMGGIPEVVEENVTGYLIPYGSVKKLADVIISLLQDRGRAKKMGINGRIRVLRNFTWSAVSERIQKVYNELLFHQS